MDNFRHITIVVPEHVYFHFKHKCSFCDLSRFDVVITLLEKFIDGDFDKDFGIEGFIDERYRSINSSD